MALRPQDEIDEELERLNAPLSEEAARQDSAGLAVLDEVLSSDEEFAKRVIQAGGVLRDEERRYSMTLAAVRKAMRLTQNEVAERLNISQASISQLESNDDVLTSTLERYFSAVGLNVRIVVEIPGKGEVDIALESLAHVG